MTKKILMCFVAIFAVCVTHSFAESANEILKEHGQKKGLCAIVGLPKNGSDSIIEIVKKTNLTVYFQSDSEQDIIDLCKVAEEKKLLGTRLFINRSKSNRINLTDNLADILFVSENNKSISKEESLRVINPNGTVFINDEKLVKDFPKGIDDWTHPYNKPDNNPVSNDEVALAPYQTQFIAEPKSCPFPTVTVAAGGKIFRAYGHQGMHSNHAELVNKILCINAFNGIILWERALQEGFMIQRNTICATRNSLYLADNKSCKIINSDSGKIQDEIMIPKDLNIGQVWKWMALENNILYALIGDNEVTVSSVKKGVGKWIKNRGGFSMSSQEAGYKRLKNLKTAPGFGQTLLAIDVSTKNILWSHSEADYIDGRSVCMNENNILFYIPNKKLGCLDIKTGKVKWNTSDATLLSAVGANGKKEYKVSYGGKMVNARGFWAETPYVKLKNNILFFSGFQREILVAVSVLNGDVLWKTNYPCRHIMLLDDGVYVRDAKSIIWGNIRKLDYQTGKEISQIECRVWGCAPITANKDSLFWQVGNKATMRFDITKQSHQLISPMRPPCIDGVLTSGGYIYWGPWMCSCNMSLLGHICLAPKTKQNNLKQSIVEKTEKLLTNDNIKDNPNDWSTLRGNNKRNSISFGTLPEAIEELWSYNVESNTRITAPVVSNGRVFIGDHAGVVYSINSTDGSVIWKNYTGGAIYTAPTVWKGRVFIGSADGWVYVFDATNGNRLWRTRVAPTTDNIFVYGKLSSRWPIAGGVVIENGIAYTAAGIAHYDGTYVWAFDPITGKNIWINDLSGTESAGISLQGDLSLNNGILNFNGGNIFNSAQYDIITGKCLNNKPAPGDKKVSGVRNGSLFHPYFLRHGQHLNLSHVFNNEKELNFSVSIRRDGRSALTLSKANLNSKSKKQTKIDKTSIIWSRDSVKYQYNAYIITKDVILVAAWLPGEKEKTSKMIAINMKDGTTLWEKQLSSVIVNSGFALDDKNRIFTSLQNGVIKCFDKQK